MAFYDWNHDGKKDFADDYLEYNIYKESMHIPLHREADSA